MFGPPNASSPGLAPWAASFQTQTPNNPRAPPRHKAGAAECRTTAPPRRAVYHSSARPSPGSILPFTHRSPTPSHPLWCPEGRMSDERGTAADAPWNFFFQDCGATTRQDRNTTRLDKSVSVERTGNEHMAPGPTTPHTQRQHTHTHNRIYLYLSEHTYYRQICS